MESVTPEGSWLALFSVLIVVVVLGGGVWGRLSWGRSCICIVYLLWQGLLYDRVV